MPGVLNMLKFWIWQGFQYTSVRQRSEYARICLDRVDLRISSEYISGSKYARILNMAGFWLYKLHRVLNMPQYSWICLNRTWICLNMSEFTIIDRVLNMRETILNARSLSTLMSSYWEIGVFRTRSKICDGKII